MKLTNLSKIGPLHALVIGDGDNTEYWMGGREFTTDVNMCNKVGTTAAMHWMDYLVKRGINARAVEVAGFYTLMKWPDVGWVVINHRDKESFAHRVYMTSAFGEGWFIKDVGTIERTLCMNLGNNTYLDLTVHGHELVDATLTADGEVMPNWTSFTIPCDSDLVYQFAFNPTPVEF